MLDVSWPVDHGPAVSIRGTFPVQQVDPIAPGRFVGCGSCRPTAAKQQREPGRRRADKQNPCRLGRRLKVKKDYIVAPGGGPAGSTVVANQRAIATDRHAGTVGQAGEGAGQASRGVLIVDDVELVARGGRVTTAEQRVQRGRAQVERAARRDCELVVTSSRTTAV